MSNEDLIREITTRACRDALQDKLQEIAEGVASRMGAALAPQFEEPQRLAEELRARTEELHARDEELRELTRKQLVLDDGLRERTGELRAREHESAELAERLRARDLELRARTEELHALQGQAEELRARCLDQGQRTSEAISLADELRARTEELHAREHDAGELRDQLRARDEELRERNQELHALQEQAKGFRARCSEQDQRISEANSLADELRARTEELHAREQDAGELTEQLRARDEELRERNQELHALQEQAEGLRTRCSEQDQRISEANSLADELHARTEELHAREHDAVELREQLHARDEELRERNQELKALGEHAKALRIRCSELGERSSDARLRDEELRARTEDLRAREHELGEVTEQLHAREEELRLHNEKSTASENQLRSHADGLQDRINGLTRVGSELRDGAVLIAGSRSQTETLEALLGAASAITRDCGLLILRGNQASGWSCHGLTALDNFRRATMDCSRGVVATVVDSHNATVTRVSELDPVFVARLGLEGSAEVVLVPVLLKERVAALLLAVNNPGGGTTELELLVQVAQLTLDLHSYRKGVPASEGDSNVRRAPHTPAAPAHARIEPAALPQPAAEPPVYAAAAKASVAPSSAAQFATPVPRQGITASQPAMDQAHEKARRFAKLLVEEIKLYNQTKVTEGRACGDLYGRLRDDIEKSRSAYVKRYGESVRDVDYFTQELIRILADNNRAAMGSAFPS